MKKTKRAISFLLCLIMLFGTYATGGNITARASGYNPDAAITYAKAHWNDGSGDCVAFLKACLKAGGVTVSGGCLAVKNALVNGGYGTLHKLTASGNLYKQSDNSGKVSKGDPLFFVCTTCGGVSSSSAWPHVALCGEGTGGYITDYAHNSDHNGASHKLWKDLENSSHPSHTMEVYAVHMNTSSNPSDNEIPLCSIHSTNNVAASQTVTLDISDNTGLAGYYWGTNSTYSSNTYTSASGKSQSITKTISSAGTYYLRVKDTAGNLSYNTSVTFYKTILNANGGSVSPSSVITMNGYSFKLPAPTKSGCTFVGWNTNSSGTGTAYAVGATYMPSGNITLYAHWKANCTTHTKGAYQYYWAAHPHYKCYKCTVCGETFPDKSETTYLSSCSTCTTPPDVTVTAGTSLTDTVITFTKNSMASHHDIHIYRPDGSRYKLIGGVSSPYSLVLPKGVYSIQVVAVIGENLIWSNAKSVTVNNALIVNYYSNYADKSFADSLNAVGADRNVIVRTATFNAAESYQYGLHDYSSTSSGTYLGRTGYTCTKNWNTKPDGSGISINELTSFSSGQELAQALGKDLSNNNATVNLYPEWKNSVDGPKTYIDKTRAQVGETITLTWDDVPNANINNYWIQCQTEGNSRVIAEINNSKRKQFTINEPGEYSIVVLAITPENMTSQSNDWKGFTVYTNYNVTLNSNCSTVSTTSSSVATDIGVQLPELNRDGYILTEWNTKVDGSGTSYDVGSTFKPTSDTTLYAIWKNAYTVFYQGLYGESKTDIVPEGYYTISPPSSNMKGLIIPAWCDLDSNEYLYYQKGDKIYVNHNLTLHAARYYENEKPAIGDVNRDGSINFNDATLAAREAASPGTLTELEKIAADVNYDGVVDEDDARKIGIMYVSEKRALTYIAGEGNGAPQGQTGSGSITLSSDKPTRSGYTFIGWSTRYSGTPEYQSGETFNLTKDTFLFAVWEEGETHTLTYNTNGGIFASLIQTSKGSITLFSEIPTRTGYNFIGWSTNSSAATAQYQPGASLNMTNDITLYAVWEQELISSGSELTSSIHYDGQIYWYKFTPSISGTYVMYSTGDSDTYGYLYNSSGERVAGDDDGGDMFNFRMSCNLTAGNDYFYGVRFYEASITGTIPVIFGPSCSILYDANYGSNELSRQTADWGQVITLSSDVFNRDSYIFLGWALNADATSAQYQPNAMCMITQNMTLYAVWQKYECSHTDTYNEIENNIDPTCTDNGSYDIVTYCYECGEETGRNTVTVSALGHSFTNYVYNNDATTEADGTETAKCDRCNETDIRVKEGTKIPTNPINPSNPTASAKLSAKSSTTVDYRSKVNITATASGVPDGYFLAIYSGNTLLEKGTKDKVSYTPKDNNKPAELKSDVTYTVKVIDGKNTVQKDSNGKDLAANVEIKVKQGFFDKLIAFFKGLFGLLPTVEIKP